MMAWKCRTPAIGGLRWSGMGVRPLVQSTLLVLVVLIVGGPRAGIAAQTPLRASAAYSPSAADQALIEEAYHERVVALAEAFAGRAPGELGL